MDIKQKIVESNGIRFSLEENGKEVARAYLYLLHNDLRQEPFALLEDVFVEESLRGQGVATKLITQIIEEAKNKGCYKIIATSRHERFDAHELYENLGFKNFGLEFKMYF
ncbi:MAG: GNAT family N-acetyltransferase [Patescibacteria group bacterium]|nr:GNAT family N-acetyltransferase [Patescibacteria group bacterium]